MVDMIWLQAAYVSLAVISAVGLLFAYLKFKSPALRKTLRKIFFSTMLLDVGIIVHTLAVLKFGSDNAQFLEVVAGHVLIALGLLFLMFSIKEVEEISKQIGFGG